MKVIVGSSDLWPTPHVASKVLTIMISTDEDIAIRSTSRREVPSMVEELARRIGDRIGRKVIHFESNMIGSNAGFSRDVRMVKAANEVFAFFSDEGPLESGTAHVVSCALVQQVPVTAYGLDEDGCIIEIGSEGGTFYRKQFNHTPTEGLPNEEVGWHR